MESTTYKERYLKAFEKRLLAFYETSKQVGETNDKQHYGIDVFIEAGIVSGLTNKEELQPIIDKHHWNVFKQTIQQRRQDLTINAAAEGKYSKLDSPAWERQGVKIK